MKTSVDTDQLKGLGSKEAAAILQKDGITNYPLQSRKMCFKLRWG